jgi:WD40 repeat protein
LRRTALRAFVASVAVAAMPLVEVQAQPCLEKLLVFSRAVTNNPHLETRGATSGSACQSVLLGGTPAGVALSHHGTAFVWIQNDGPLLELDLRTGALLRTAVTEGAGGSIQGRGVALMPNGDFLVAGGSSNRVARFSSQSGAFLGNFVVAGATGLNTPFGLTYGPNGNLFVGSFGSGQVFEFHGATGALVRVFVQAGAGGLQQPYDLAFGPDGDLYVSDRDLGLIRRFDGQTGQSLGQFSSVALPPLRGIAFGPNGNLFACTWQSPAGIYEFDGETGMVIGQKASGNAPIGIAFERTSGAHQWCANGHWYEVLVRPNISWSAASAEAQARGGHLATLTTAAEHEFVFSHAWRTPGALSILRPGQVDQRFVGPWLGGYQIPGSAEPASGWAWVTGEPWSYTNWAGDPQPDNDGGAENFLHISNLGSDWLGTWNDRANDDANPDPGFVVEYESVIIRQPADAVACVQGRATISIQVVPFAEDALRFQWRRNGIPVSFATNATARTSTLVIQQTSSGDLGNYDCVIGTPCGEVHSESGVLRFWNPADFDEDGDVGTDADIEAFFACLAGHCCSSCGPTDINGDGDAGTDADIESFFRVLAGGTC